MKTERPGREASCLATASAAAAFWAMAIVERGLWIVRGASGTPAYISPSSVTGWCGGFKMSARARMSLMADLRFPSTMSLSTERKKTLNKQFYQLTMIKSLLCNSTPGRRLWHSDPFGWHKLQNLLHILLPLLVVTWHIMNAIQQLTILPNIYKTYLNTMAIIQSCKKNGMWLQTYPLSQWGMLEPHISEILS